MLYNGKWINAIYIFNNNEFKIIDFVIYEFIYNYKLSKQFQFIIIKW